MSTFLLNAVDPSDAAVHVFAQAGSRLHDRLRGIANQADHSPPIAGLFASQSVEATPNTRLREEIGRLHDRIAAGMKRHMEPATVEAENSRAGLEPQFVSAARTFTPFPTSDRPPSPRLHTELLWRRGPCDLESHGKWGFNPNCPDCRAEVLSHDPVVSFTPSRCRSGHSLHTTVLNTPQAIVSTALSAERSEFQPSSTTAPVHRVFLHSPQGVLRTSLILDTPKTESVPVPKEAPSGATPVLAPSPSAQSAQQVAPPMFETPSRSPGPGPQDEPLPVPEPQPAPVVVSPPILHPMPSRVTVDEEAQVGLVSEAPAVPVAPPPATPAVPQTVVVAPVREFASTAAALPASGAARRSRSAEPAPRNKASVGTCLRQVEDMIVQAEKTYLECHRRFLECEYGTWRGKRVCTRGFPPPEQLFTPQVLRDVRKLQVALRRERLAVSKKSDLLPVTERLTTVKPTAPFVGSSLLASSKSFQASEEPVPRNRHRTPCHRAHTDGTVWVRRSSAPQNGSAMRSRSGASATGCAAPKPTARVEPDPAKAVNAAAVQPGKGVRIVAGPVTPAVEPTLVPVLRTAQRSRSAGRDTQARVVDASNWYRPPRTTGSVQQTRMTPAERRGTDATSSLPLPAVFGLHHNCAALSPPPGSPLSCLSPASMVANPALSPNSAPAPEVPVVSPMVFSDSPEAMPPSNWRKDLAQQAGYTPASSAHRLVTPLLLQPQCTRPEPRTTASDSQYTTTASTYTSYFTGSRTATASEHCPHCQQHQGQTTRPLLQPLDATSPQPSGESELLEHVTRGQTSTSLQDVRHRQAIETIRNDPLVRQRLQDLAKESRSEN
eukprot:TRINITY_DN1962_c0_g1_i1.p1 TRINITY_DN1962_c0_g1~~TRINITY_DN1962_c0_g1_i1.p1  ORF type:complete len:834 (-),score=50.04 TRINITY_DN1962_c0_g1_i1:65-2566(-)